MTNDQSQNLNDCGCCEGTTVQTPAPLDNRPGLDEIVYRVGTHSQFKESMLARLSSGDLPALAGLQTRDDGDFSLALLDSWAMVADVLTFYQERLANEAFLRTADQRRSILELARLIGYQLRPGVAASTYLAFTLEEPPKVAAPGTTGLATSNLAQAPGSIFIQPGVAVQSVPGPDEKPQTFETVEQIEARPAWNAIRPRLTVPQALRKDITELWLQRADLNLQAGDILLIVTSTPGAAVKRVEQVEPDPQGQRTRLILETVRLTVLDRRAQIEQGVWVMRTKAAPFGHNAPQRTRLIPDAFTVNLPAGPVSTITQVTEYEEWDLDLDDDEDVRLALDLVYDEIVSGSLVVADHPLVQALFLAEEVGTRSRAKYGITGRVTELKLNAAWANPQAKLKLTWLRKIVVYAQSEKLEQAEMPWTFAISGKLIDLPSGGHGLKAGQTIVVSGQLQRPGEEEATTAEDKEPTSEIAVIEQVVTVELVGKKYDNLVLENELQHTYRRDTVTINANVARATHGESVSEVMGSGDGSQAGQQFVLRQPPLTHVSAETPSGSQSTLEVRVNGVLWREEPSLFGRGSDERNYIARLNDDGTTTVQVGDGINGARLPTGANNVRAWYRKGIGVGGLVKARQLSLLMKPPLGVKEVVNPEPATGAENPESRDDARRNAPLTVLTLDRVVSLQDFEDFSRAFAGVAKALATWSWRGDRRSVTITVAGPESPDGAHDVGDLVLEKLEVSLRKHGDPLVPFDIVPYRPATFVVKARVKAHPDHVEENVLAKVETTLRNRFSFDARQFGQPAARSEVIAAMQQVTGVEAVDLDRFQRSDADTDQVVITEQLFAAVMSTEAAKDAGLNNIQWCKPGTEPTTVERGLLENALQILGIEGIELESVLLEAFGRPRLLEAKLPAVDAEGNLLGAELLTLDDRPLQLGLLT